MKAYATFSIILITVCRRNLLSEAIVVPKSSYEYRETYTNTYFPRREVESEIFTTAVSCLIRFLHRNLPGPNRVPTLISTKHICRNTQYLLKELQSEISILLVGGNFNSTLYNPGLSILLLLDDISAIENVTSNLVNLCSRTCVYVAIVTKFYENKHDFMEDADVLGHLLWERKIADVAIISIFGDSIQLAKSLSFRPGEILELSSPKFFGSCEETRGWETEKDNIFSPIALNDGIANGAFFEIEPYVIIDENQIIRGIEGDLLNAVCKSLRLELIADEIMWTLKTNDIQEIRIRLYNRSHDIILGALNWSPNSEIDYTFPYKVARYVWLIPVVPNVSLRGLIAPFQNSVWYAVGIVSIFTIIIKTLILHDITFLDVFAIIIGTSVAQQPEKLSSRIQFLSWALFGYVLSQSYLASLAGVLVEEANQQIQTMEELISAGIQYGGTRRLRELFATSDEKDDSNTDDISNSDVIRTIYNNFVVMQYEEYLQSLQDLISGKNKNMALVVVQNSSSEQKFDETKVQQLKEPLGIYPLAFAVWKGLPFVDRIDKKILALTEGGFVGFWDRRYIFIDSDLLRNDDSSDVLGLNQLVPGFLLIVMGCLAGILELFVEIAFDTFRKRRVIKERVNKIASIGLKKARRNKDKMSKTAKSQITKFKKVKLASNSKWNNNNKKTEVNYSRRVSNELFPYLP